MGTTSTEYLLRGIGMKSWVTYNWNTPANIFSLNTAALSSLATELLKAQADGVVPMTRIPLTASYWLGVPTKAAGANFGKYPQLGAQYRNLVHGMVEYLTSRGIVVSLDLHWNDDDTQQQPMALRQRSDGGPTGNSVTFWQSIAAAFGNNSMTVFELYNEPHTDTNTWLHGSSQYVGMMELAAAVRSAGAPNMLFIAGAAAYAYDADSLVQLASNATFAANNVFAGVFHPYMGPAQAGASNKCTAGFGSMVDEMYSKTDVPVVATEFGQACCATDGACESCAATGDVGYDEAIVQLLANGRGSWMPWAWRPEGNGDGGGGSCEDLNGGNPLVHPTNGKGADWFTLWPKYAASP